ncbi:MAG TPA: biotin carboxylase N-terminal domain-containing protein [Trebonia sp.]|nr:biotin carboxylase N-terminal domain-containing protein [Trebonia sp.]
MTRGFRRVLIANRGEIAARVIRTCARLGIETVLAASDADLNSVPARLAGRVIRIGPAPASESYLNVDAIVGAALAVRADAVHPGYGFLSESPLLARALAAAGVAFIGPRPETLAVTGDKLAAREQAATAGIPVLPGGRADESTARDVAARVGYPVLVKAVGGGGGRGLRVVGGPKKLALSLSLATAEAYAAFGDPRLYIERYVAPARHVEVQILGDGQQVVHLGDRDCSVQRRYQKLIEEAPAPGLPEPLREELRRAAVALGRHLRYRGAGTVEFLVDVTRGTFYFLEVNARIQVEHPVTEAVTGCDLVAEQLWIAEGRPLRLSQNDIAIRGHAIEVRVNAEDRDHGFLPSPGTISGAAFPAGPGIRIDSYVQPGSAVPPFYDSLVAKVIVHGADREEARGRLAEALARCEISGVATILPLLRELLATAEFRRGGVDTGYLGRVLAGPGGASGARVSTVVAAAGPETGDADG